MSLGVNNIPLKHCTYSCVYCQLGRTKRPEIERRAFYGPDEVVDQVIRAVEEAGEKIDYITFVPDGEPTLDVNLGKMAEKIKEVVSVPVAVLTNGSLVYRDDVVSDLSVFDLVSFKIDAADVKTWRLVNRPHPGLKLGRILEAIKDFTATYSGTVITETMLVSGVNDSISKCRRVAEFLKELKIKKAYIAVPIRPPSEPWVKPPAEDRVLSCYSLMWEYLGESKVELMIGYEKSNFKLVGDPVKALLATTSVHPMRIDYAYKYLTEKGLDPDKVIPELVSSGEIAIVEYRGHRFIIRKFG
ncbi:MAG: radical SAM protein [Desulfurococcales archaeon]|nr:radical SAM protein [Desulfurococcales archaeon]